MRIAIAQINPILGNFKYNSQKILEYILRAKAHHCELVLFPEASLSGYHPFDLLEHDDFVKHQSDELMRLKKQIPRGITAVIGGFTARNKKTGRPFFNSAFILNNKKIEVFHKTLLPTGDVFDEARFVETGDLQKNLFKLNKKNIFITICEDIWAWPDKSGRSPYLENPLKKVKPKNKIDFVINISASPYFLKKMQLREWVVGQTARHLRAPTFYVNMVGAQDEVIYDGRSFVVDSKGQKKLELLAHAEDFAVVDLAQKKMATGRTKQSELDLLKNALVIGIRDFANKNGFKKVHLGLSGGIDSAVVAALAVEALGASNVKTYFLPSRFSSEMSERLASQLAKNLGVAHANLPIEGIFSQVSMDLKVMLGIDTFSLVHENVQSRIRGLLLMAISNKDHSLLLATGNKSELAAGYSTLYGDLCGGLLPIGDLTKKEVIQLANLYKDYIPAEIVTRPPTAELRENQKDEDTLPPYSQLDPAVEKLVEFGQFEKNQAGQWLKKVFFRQEFKRWQAPPVLKVKARSFGKGRRWPISHQFGR